MRPATVGGLSVDTCPTCAALWLERSVLAELHRILCRDSTAFRRPFVPRPSEALLSCSACSDGHLQPGAVRSVRAYRCTSCRGVFLPAGVLPSPPPTEQDSGEFEPDGGAAAFEFLADIVGALF